MAKIKVLAGDFKMNLRVSLDMLFAPHETGWGADQIPIADLKSVEIASQDRISKLAGKAKSGAHREAALNSPGWLAGLLPGKGKKKVTFVAKFKDGRWLLGTTDSKTFRKLQATVS